MRIYTLCTFLLLSTQMLLAWGQIGHRAVGEIAESHLNKKAKKAVRSLLGHESMALASTYMDEIRSDSTFDYTHDWHWVTIPYGETYASSEKNPNGDVIEAIGRMCTTLKSDTASQSNKAQALKFLIHLVGDMHQPLHVGNGTDKGGNDVKVKFMWENSNLHRVWDSDMIDKKQLSYTELAASLNHYSKAEKEQYSQGTVAEWAQEAQLLHPLVYDFRDVGMLSYEYSYQCWPTVQQQLRLAGFRLAHLLNSIFG